MKTTKIIKILLAAVLCVAMLLPYVPVRASAAKLDNFDTSGDFSGVKLSVIGDSISSYYGVTNSSTYNPLYLTTSEATFGTYYGNTSHGDYAEFSHVKRADTWWQQVVDTLGVDLLVNNSWSGSFLVKDTAQSNTTEYGAAAYKDRSVNLHKGSTNPDIIAVYMGTNDVANYSSTNIGSKAEIDTASERNALYKSVNSFSTPSSSVAAYYIMISRMVAKYPNAEIYCMLPTICLATMPSGRTTALNNLNDGIKYIVDYYQSQGKKVYLVDLDKDCDLGQHDTVKNYYYCNNVHPEPEGMDMITSCVINEILEHSTKGKQTAVKHQITTNLTDCFEATGPVAYGIQGKPLKLKLLPYRAGKGIAVSATMTNASTGKTTTYSCTDTLYIPEVTGPITINAEPASDNFAWKAESYDLVSQFGPGLNYNNTTLVGGTYTGTANSDGTYTGTCSNVQYSLDEPVVLAYDKPWVLEWQSGGSTYAGGIMLFNKEADSGTDGNMYIHVTQTNVFFGYRTNSLYHNCGVSWETIASKLGSSAGDDIRKEILDFKIVNNPNGTNNTLRLYVNGVDMGDMGSSKLIGSSATHASVSEIDISGKDFVFNYIGSASHPLNNCAVNYIRVWENGKKDFEPTYENYRWELNSAQDDLVSRNDSIYTANGLTTLKGSISGGTFTDSVFAMSNTVTLLHDKVWRIEWASEGDWVGNRNGSMLLAADLYYKANGSPYLYRRNASYTISLGEWADGNHHNYGVYLGDYGIDGTAYHKYALVNELTKDASGNVIDNMVYLYVDDVKISAMDTHFVSSDTTGEKSDWVSGKDFTFSYLGTTEFSIGGVDLDYLEITTECTHAYGDWTVQDATCTTDGLKSRTCTICGNVEEIILPATDHSYGNWVVTDATCTEDGVKTKTCANCGDVISETIGAVGHSYGDWVVTNPTCTEDGIKTKTCANCGDVVKETIAAPGHSYKEEVVGATCTAYGYTRYTCTACGHSYTETYVDAGKGEHNFQYAICTECGAHEDVGNYYLFGYINGADYACESDYQNMGEYVFVNGKLTVTFNQDSYVAVKTEGNKHWYMTNGWLGTEVSNATLYHCDTIDADDKLFVPGHMVITFTLTENADGTLSLSYTTAPCEHSYSGRLDKAPTCTEDGAMIIACAKCGHSYVDVLPAIGHSYSSVTTDPTCESAGSTTCTCGTCGYSYTEEIPALGHSYVKGVCSVCGAKDPDYVEVVAPTITLKTPTLLLEDTIKLNIYYTIDQDIALEKMGMLTWSSKPDVVDIATAENVYPGATFNDGNGFYGVNTDGIPAQNLGDIIYFCIYAELADGSIAYGKQVQYSPVTYAYNQINGGASAEMKALLVAILNYGAAAQTYLEDTDPLVNANLTDDMKALVEAYRSDMVHSVAMPSASKQGAMAANGGFGAKKPSISLDGAFSINYYFTPSAEVSGDMTFYYWNAADFAAVDVLSVDNATGSAVMTNNNGEYSAAISGIAAKDIDGALYACGVYTDVDGNTYSTGILPYSLGFYCGNQAKGEGALADLAAAIAVYGYYASIYFAM